jgi:hypothetical protein
MPTNRFLPALAVALGLPLLVLAQAPTPPAPAAPATDAATPPPPTAAEKFIDEAIAKVSKVESLVTDIRQDVRMLGVQYRVEGQYLRAPGYRVKLRLDVVNLSNVSGTMLQISDGLTFWDYKKVLDSIEVHKRTLKPILEKLDSPGADTDLREKVLSNLGFPGPEALLSGLRKAIGFDQMEEGELAGRKVQIVRGRWKDRERLTGPNQPPLPATGPLPPYVPSLAEVWIDQESGWPHLVKLIGRAPSIMETKKDLREMGVDGRALPKPITPPRTDPSEIALVYTNLQLNPKIDPAEFAFEPPKGEGVRIIDDTQAITNDLTNALAELAARKKAEAAKEGSELPQGITIPRPAGAINPAVPPPAEPPASAPAPK